MALQDYSQFLENSLDIDVRYPTLEEFLLALGNCIPEKASEDEKKHITDSKLGRRVISKKDITRSGSRRFSFIIKDISMRYWRLRSSCS